MSSFIPNSFQVPNIIIDEYMAKMSASAFKVYLVMVRKTKGWHKDFDSLSQSQIMELTGIVSNNTVKRAIEELVELGLVQEHKIAGKQSTFFVSLHSEILEGTQNLTPSKIADPSCNNCRTPLQKLQHTPAKIADTKDTNQNTLTKNTNKKHSASEDAVRIANHLANKILIRNPEAKIKPSCWLVDIDDAIRLDGRKPDDLIAIIDWIYTPAGAFWMPNILSGKKLRSKFDSMRMQAGRAISTQKTPAPDNFSQKNYGTSGRL